MSAEVRPALRARVAVPATCANLGPGFDVLAVALELQNEVTIVQTPGTGIVLDCGSDAPAELRDPACNLVVRAYAEVCSELGVPAGGVEIRCVNRIPLRRGLGSSAAAALSGVLAAVALHRPAWDEGRILQRCAALEGHADNAAAALLGGLAIAAPGAPPVSSAVPEELVAVVFVPDHELATAAARAVVPRTLSRDDAIFNSARVGLLVRAVLERDWASLGRAMEDRWHQPQRSRLMPWLPDLVAAARDAGAAGAALSGAGPSVIALTWRQPEAVERGFAEAARSHGLAGRSLVSRVRNYGARVDVGLAP